MNDKIKKLKNEAIDILEACNLKWDDDYLNPKDYSPAFDLEFVDEMRWFNIVLGQLIAEYSFMRFIKPAFNTSKNEKKELSWEEKALLIMENHLEDTRHKPMIFSAMKEFATLVCQKQKEICAFQVELTDWAFEFLQEGAYDVIDLNTIKNAPTVKFD